MLNSLPRLIISKWIQHRRKKARILSTNESVKNDIFVDDGDVMMRSCGQSHKSQITFKSLFLCPDYHCLLQLRGKLNNLLFQSVWYFVCEQTFSRGTPIDG